MTIQTDRRTEKELEDLNAMRGRGVEIEPPQVDIRRYDGCHILTERERHTCYYCGHYGADVNKHTVDYIGGVGNIYPPMCDDLEACLKRRSDD